MPFYFLANDEVHQLGGFIAKSAALTG